MFTKMADNFIFFLNVKNSFSCSNWRFSIAGSFPVYIFSILVFVFSANSVFTTKLKKE